MITRPEREEYWHWFHGLADVTPKEKEDLLQICPDVELWYEAGKKKCAGELMGPVCMESEKQINRKKSVQTTVAVV